MRGSALILLEADTFECDGRCWRCACRLSHNAPAAQLLVAVLRCVVPRNLRLNTFAIKRTDGTQQHPVL
jgi:hypothetical protein